MGGEDMVGSGDRARRPDHVCFAFTDPAEFQEAARSFLAEGLAAGNRVLMAVSRPGEDESWRRDKVFGSALARGQADVVLVEPAGGGTGVVDPPARVTACRDATRQALDRGFTGLRIAADVTSLLGNPAGIDAYARYEYLVDRYIAASPLSGMCGYHGGAVPAASLAQMACLHPSGNPSAATSFRLYARPDGACALAGYLDFTCLELLRSTLERTRLPAAGQTLTVDASRLEFADHNSLLALEEAARERRATVVIRGNAPHVHRLVELMELTAVRVEVTR